MNRLFFFLLLVGLFVQAQGQHPSFLPGKQWGKGPFSGIQVVDSLAWYLEGSVLVSAVIQPDLHLAQLAEMELNMAPGNLSAFHDYLVVYGNELVVLKRELNGGLIEVLRETREFDNACMAGKVLYLGTDYEFTAYLELNEQTEVQLGQLTVPIDYEYPISSDLGLFVADWNGIVRWFSTVNPVEPELLDTLNCTNNYRSAVTFIDSSLVYLRDTSLIVISPNSDNDLIRTDTVGIQSLLGDLWEIDFIQSNGDLIFAGSQNIVGSVWSVARVSAGLSISAFSKTFYFTDPVFFSINNGFLVYDSGFLSYKQEGQSDPVLTSVLTPSIGYLGQPFFNPNQPEFISFYEQGEILLVNNLSTVPEVKYELPYYLTDVLYDGYSACSLENGLLFITQYSEFGFLDFISEPIKWQPVNFWLEEAPFCDLELNGKILLARTDSWEWEAENWLYKLRLNQLESIVIEDFYLGTGQNSISDVTWLGDRIIISESDSGITVTDTTFQLIQRIRNIGRVNQIKTIKGGVAALLGNGTIQVFYQEESGFLKQAETTISVGSSNVIMETADDFLLVISGRTLFVIDVKNAFHPVLAGQISLQFESTGMVFTGEKLVISNGRYGYALYDYTGYKVGVEHPKEGIPAGFAIESVYPNPFNPTATIAYRVPVAGEVTMTVYDLTGREIARLVNGKVGAGYHEVPFHAPALASGVYLVRIQLATGQQATARMMLVK